MPKAYFYMWSREGTIGLTVEEVLCALGKKRLQCKQESGKSGPELVFEGFDKPLVLSLKDGRVVRVGLELDVDEPKEEALYKAVAGALKRLRWTGMLSSAPAEDLPPGLAPALGTGLHIKPARLLE